MLKCERTSVMNFENAIRGARNPLNSWAKSDSRTEADGSFVFGPADLDLAGRLARAGSDHRKFLRMIFVSVDITAPLYWWKEFDTYKVGTVANSTSTMHKIHSKEFSLGDFSTDRMNGAALGSITRTVSELEALRLEYNEIKEKSVWYSIIQLLPTSYNQLRTVTLNYENLISIYYARRDHKLDEWHTLCDWISELPYAQDLIMIK